jgi:hypothetical protein
LDVLVFGVSFLCWDFWLANTTFKVFGFVVLGLGAFFRGD